MIKPEFGLSAIEVGIVTGRFVMGLAVGALSVTVPIYLSEIAPARLRGALSGLRERARRSWVIRIRCRAS